MSIGFDGEGVEHAAAHLGRRADAARLLVAAAARLPRDLGERRLSLAALALADLTGDLAELAALDLQLVATRLRAGSRLLTGTELGLAAEGDRR